MKKWSSYARGVLAEIGFICALMLIGLIVSLLNW
jgi:hypothetical protein